MTSLDLNVCCVHLFCCLICYYIYRCPGSTPLHLAAKGGSLDCIRELLAWGADRLQRDASGYILVSEYEFLPLDKISPMMINGFGFPKEEKACCYTQFLISTVNMS